MELYLGELGSVFKGACFFEVFHMGQHRLGVLISLIAEQLLSGTIPSVPQAAAFILLDT